MNNYTQDVNEVLINLADLNLLTKRYEALSKKYEHNEDSDLYKFHLEMLQSFSIKIQQLLTLLANKPSCSIISKKIDRASKKNIFVIDINSSQMLEIYAENIFRNKNIFNRLSQYDLYEIAYTHGMEYCLEEDRIMNEIKKLKSKKQYH